jgi:hypothetical protein
MDQWNDNFNLSRRRSADFSVTYVTANRRFLFPMFHTLVLQ